MRYSVKLLILTLVLGAWGVDDRLFIYDGVSVPTYSAMNGFGPNIGMLGPLLDAIHLPGLKRDWLADRFLTFKLVMLVQAWQWNGMAVVLYLAGLQNVPEDLRHAALVDGAKPWQVFRDVTFPLLAPAFTIVTASGRSSVQRSLAIARIARDLQIARMDVSGVFKDFNPDEDAEDLLDQDVVHHPRAFFAVRFLTRALAHHRVAGVEVAP